MQHQPYSIYLNKKWYRAHELPALTGIPRSLWRLYKKRDGVWIWRKMGTYPSAPVYLHVESIADEFDRRRLSYRVDIGGREADPAMTGYRHEPPVICRPKGRFTRSAAEGRDRRATCSQGSAVISMLTSIVLQDPDERLLGLLHQMEHTALTGESDVEAVFRARFEGEVRSLQVEARLLRERVRRVEQALERAGHYFPHGADPAGLA